MKPDDAHVSSQAFSFDRYQKQLQQSEIFLRDTFPISGSGGKSWNEMEQNHS